MTRSVKGLLGAVLLAVVTFGWPVAADAHSTGVRRTQDAAHYLTQVDGISPAAAGVSATVDPRGEWIDVTNSTSQTLTVLGYSREPYLQISPTGVSENAFSPTAQLNQSLFIDVTQMPGASASMPPDWQAKSAAQQYRWHDHRIHWMGVDRPPEVKAHPERGQSIGHWTVHMTLGAQPISINGSLSWLPVTPKKSLIVKLGVVADVAFVLAAVTGACVFAVRHRRRRSEPDDRTVMKIDKDLANY